jgi:hypothetical protein
MKNTVDNVPQFELELQLHNAYAPIINKRYSKLFDKRHRGVVLSGYNKILNLIFNLNVNQSK